MAALTLRRDGFGLRAEQSRLLCALAEIFQRRALRGLESNQWPLQHCRGSLPNSTCRSKTQAEFKSEYYDGQMFAMSGGSLPHSTIPMQLAAALVNALRGRGCRVASSDLRVRVSAKGPFFYPDLKVFCGEPQLADDHQDILLNPRVLYSRFFPPSSEAFDRGLKFEAYSEIESLEEYILISPIQNHASRSIRDSKPASGCCPLIPVWKPNADFPASIARSVSQRSMTASRLAIRTLAAVPPMLCAERPA